MDELFSRIMEAHETIRSQLPVTPLQRSPVLSEAFGCEVLLKCDHLQPTGTFKIRGATNKIRVLDRQARRQGVITASTGNHGQAAAMAAQVAGVPITVYVPATIPAAKAAAIRAFGAELVLVDAPPMQAELQARQAATDQGLTYISPYNDIDVVAGQGTLGAELADQEKDLDAVFVALGGGGLIGGVGTALKALTPETRVVGVSAENSAAMIGALKAGRIVDVEERDTLSEATTGAIEPGSITFPICQRVIDETFTVTEAEIGAGMRRIAQSDRWMIEGAAGVAVAGFLKKAGEHRGGKVAVVLCGRNIAVETYLQAVGGAE